MPLQMFKHTEEQENLPFTQDIKSIHTPVKIAGYRDVKKTKQRNREFFFRIFSPTFFFPRDLESNRIQADRTSQGEKSTETWARKRAIP